MPPRSLRGEPELGVCWETCLLRAARAAATVMIVIGDVVVSVVSGFYFFLAALGLAKEGTSAPGEVTKCNFDPSFL